MCIRDRGSAVQGGLVLTVKPGVASGSASSAFGGFFPRLFAVGGANHIFFIKSTDSFGNGVQVSSSDATVTLAGNAANVSVVGSGLFSVLVRVLPVNSVIWMSSNPFSKSGQVHNQKHTTLT